MTELQAPNFLDPELRVISADTLVAGTHFLSHAQPADIACKSLAVNLSDLAAMGAAPSTISLVIGNPPEAKHWQLEFLQAFEIQCHQHRLILSSINCVEGPTHVSIQAVGRVRQSQALLRSAAKAGDGVYVSGTLGDAGLGLQIALGHCAVKDHEARNYCLARLHRPTPRIALGLALRGLSKCAIDISDGLCGDLLHICERSQVGIKLQTSRLPLSKALRDSQSAQQARDLALTAGDDYELCFTAPQQAHTEIMSVAQQLHLPLTLIGQVETAPGLRIIDEQGQELPVQPAYQHFLTPLSEPA